MEEQIHAQPEQPEEARNHPLKQKVGLGVGTFAAMGLLDLLAHLGPTGLVVGGILAYAASQQGPELIDQMRDLLPASAAHEPGNEQPQRSTGKRTFMQRALGRFPEGYEQWMAAHDDEPGQQHPAPHQTEEREQQSTLSTHLKLGRVKGSKERFDPAINGILGKGVAIAGSPGAGKSNLIGMMAAGAANCGMSVVAVDFKREYYPLLDIVPCGLYAGHPSFATEGGEKFFPLTPETAKEFADIVMTYGPYGFLAIIDSPSYGADPDLLGETIAAVLTALMDWSQAQAEGDRLPCLTFIDEAHNYFPQGKGLSAFPMKEATFQGLQSAYNRMATAGRSYGHTLVLATQRIANIAKWSIATLQIKVIMRHGEQNDLKRCEAETSAAEPELVKTLEDGVGIIVGMSKAPLIVQFDRQKARHVSITPGIERAHAKRGERPAQPPRLSRVLAERNEQPSQKPDERSKTPATPVLPAAKESDQSHARLSRTGSPLLQQALDIFESGWNHHDLSLALDIDVELASALLRQIKARRHSELETGSALAHPVNSSTAPASEAVVVPVRPVPVKQELPEPTLDDAIGAWNKLVESDIEPGRGTLDKALRDAGFVCGENKARLFVTKIKKMLEESQQIPLDR